MDNGIGQRTIRVQFPMRTVRTGAEIWDELDYNDWVGIWPSVQLPVQPMRRGRDWLVPVIKRIRFTMDFDAVSFIWGPIEDVIASGGGQYTQAFSIQPAQQVTIHDRFAVWQWKNISVWGAEPDIPVQGPPEVINPPQAVDWVEDTNIKIFRTMNLHQAFDMVHNLVGVEEGFCMPNGNVWFDFDIEYEVMDWIQFAREKNRDYVTYV